MTELKTIEQRARPAGTVILEHFPELTPVEVELLALLAEECGELVQAIGKILRHGLTSYHPEHPDQSNRARLAHEMGDVRAAMILVCEAGIVAKTRVHERADDKLRRVNDYLHHAVVPMALRGKSK